jgi:putative ABC transport system permease protein
MFTNYFKVALRSLLRHKLFTLINVVGLSLGIACCILVYLFVESEQSFDAFHSNGDRIFRVNLGGLAPSGELKTRAGQPLPLAAALKSSFPEVARATRLGLSSAVVRSKGNAPFTEDVHFADQDFLEMFSFPLRSGDAHNALLQKNSVVITTQIATKYFGAENPVGSRLSIALGGVSSDYLVSGVAEDIPQNSSIRFDILLPYENIPFYKRFSELWTSWAAPTFIELKQTSQASDVRGRLPEFVSAHYKPMIQTWQILGWLAKSDNALRLEFQPLTSIHLRPDVQDQLIPVSNPTISYVLSGIALLVLGLALMPSSTPKPTSSDEGVALISRALCSQRGVLPAMRCRCGPPEADAGAATAATPTTVTPLSKPASTPRRTNRNDAIWNHIL